MASVGFIGLGVMGAAMARHLMGAGYQLVLYTRTKAKAEPLLQAGARWADTPKELARRNNSVLCSRCTGGVYDCRLSSGC